MKFIESAGGSCLFRRDLNSMSRTPQVLAVAFRGRCIVGNYKNYLEKTASLLRSHNGPPVSELFLRDLEGQAELVRANAIIRMLHPETIIITSATLTPAQIGVLFNDVDAHQVEFSSCRIIPDSESSVNKDVLIHADCLEFDSHTGGDVLLNRLSEKCRVATLRVSNVRLERLRAHRWPPSLERVQLSTYTTTADDIIELQGKFDNIRVEIKCEYLATEETVRIRRNCGERFTLSVSHEQAAPPLGSPFD